MKTHRCDDISYQKRSRLEHTEPRDDAAMNHSTHEPMSQPTYRGLMANVRFRSWVTRWK